MIFMGLMKIWEAHTVDFSRSASYLSIWKSIRERGHNTAVWWGNMAGTGEENHLASGKALGIFWLPSPFQRKSGKYLWTSFWYWARSIFVRMGALERHRLHLKNGGEWTKQKNFSGIQGSNESDGNWRVSIRFMQIDIGHDLLRWAMVFGAYSEFFHMTTQEQLPGNPKNLSADYFVLKTFRSSWIKLRYLYNTNHSPFQG